MRNLYRTLNSGFPGNCRNKLKYFYFFMYVKNGYIKSLENCKHANVIFMLIQKTLHGNKCSNRDWMMALKYLLHTALQPVWIIPIVKPPDSKCHYKLCKISSLEFLVTSTLEDDIRYRLGSDSRLEKGYGTTRYHRYEHTNLHPTCETTQRYFQLVAAIAQHDFS